MQVCFGCQHSFPSTAVERVDFSQELVARLESLRSLIGRTQPSTSMGRQAVAAMEDETRALLAAVRKEVDDKTAKIKKLEMQLSFLNKENEELRRKQISAAVAPPVKPKSARSASHVGPSGMLDRFLAANGQQRDGGGQREGARPSPPPVASPRTSGGNQPLAPSVKPVDVVSAAIYYAVEAVTVRTRAEVGVLWLKPHDSGELVAPFIAGQHHTSHSRSSAPYRIPGSSLVGLVAATGIAVNLSPASAEDDRSSKSEADVAGALHASGKHLNTSVGTKPTGGPSKTGEHSFSKHLEGNKCANLLVPVYSRYGDAERTTIGVIQLIGSSKSPFPFGERNEATAIHIAALLSHVISAHISSMLAEWSTRMYDSSLITGSACYDATLDQRADEKAFDDFDPTPCLVFRCENCERANPTNLAQTKTLRNEIMVHATPAAAPTDSLKDIHRYLRSLEDNWSNSVTTQTLLEKKNDALTAQLDAARQGFHNSRGDMAYRQPSQFGSTFQRSNANAVTTVDVEDIENDVMQRIKKSSTATFLTQDGELSTPMKRRAQGLIP